MQEEEGYIALDQKDLDAIRNIMKEELSLSENLVLEELERMRNILEGQIGLVQKIAE